MADDTNTPQANGGSEDSGRGRFAGNPRESRQREGGPREGGPREGGQRQGGQRDAGGFRIRLSDNELQAARALQEAFGLRSTVAVLGFALRTLAQQLEAGQLDELVSQQRAQAAQRPPSPRAAGGGEREGRRGEGRATGAGGGGRGQRIDPFARPSRPAAPAAEPDLSEQQASAPAETETAADLDLAVTEAGPDSAVPDQADGGAIPDISPEAEAAVVSTGDA
ncbi:MAG: hypothetical protein WAM11_14175 [Cyanobium sp.]